MVSINDFFGKASADNDYAAATTVKATRLPGETVLACFDLSKYSQDTPVFFITYRKSIDPVTEETTITNQTGWKGIVNADNNTITDLTLAPGYTDTGNAVGDYVEPVPTSFWANELVNGLAVSHNADGSLKEPAVLGSLQDTRGVLGNEVYFATVGSSTYTKPEGLKFVIVEVQGGGAGGGCGGATSSGQSSYGGGGGGGAYARKKILATELSATETVTVGGGGLGGRSGNGSGDNGAESSFGEHCSARGGYGGDYRTGGSANGQNAPGGVGGNGGVGDIVIYGSGGGAGLQDSNSTRGNMGAGGASHLGGGTDERNNGSAAGSVVGRNGFQYGGGGGGGGNGANSSTANGGRGAQGVVIVHEYF